MRLDQNQSPHSQARGPYRKSARRRIDILAAAGDVFAESGYRSGSLREVAARVGISEAGVLHHFPSKSSLLTAVLDRRDELSRAAVRSDPQDGAGTLADLVALARFNATQAGVVELDSTLTAEATSPDHPAHEYFVNRYRALRASLGTAFADLERRGLLTPGVDVRGATISSLAVWDGLQVQWLLGQHELDVPAELAAHFRRLTTAGIP